MIVRNLQPRMNLITLTKPQKRANRTLIFMLLPHKIVQTVGVAVRGVFLFHPPAYGLNKYNVLRTD